jgi:hypothetical protein
VESLARAGTTRASDARRGRTLSYRLDGSYPAPPALALRRPHVVYLPLDRGLSGEEG